MNINITIEKISIINYRSISNLQMELKGNNFIVICGANNIGKTNFLRALDLFFSDGKDKFDADRDIPYHIAAGSRGQGYKSTIQIIFKDQKTGDKFDIKKVYTYSANRGNVLDITGSKNGKKINNEEIKDFLDNFYFFFIEASNVNIPHIIANIVNEEILPLGLDNKRSTQKESLNKLNEFIESSKKSVSSIEKEITAIMKSFVDDIEGIDSSEWNLKIQFPEFGLLREAISGMIDFILYDTNNHALDSKGSGIQRIILLSLIKYISQKIKKIVIWGIDEPEAFLQPSLQKRVLYELKKLAINNYILITTHSHFFVDISMPDNIYLFNSTRELKEYARKPGKSFYKLNTSICELTGYQKIEQIKKHMGIESNDSWEIMPYNIIVEGEEDQKYLLTIAKLLSIDMPNIIPAGGANKIKGILGYISIFCESVKYRPKVLCILDHDEEGKKVKDEIEQIKNKNIYKNFDLDIRFIVRCDSCIEKSINYEIEDFLYPNLVYDATNKILRKKGYNIIRSADKKIRNKPAYIKKCMLDFLTDIVRSNNTDKDELNFNDLSLKRYLCQEICNNLQRIDVETLDAQYPAVRKFLNEITDN